MLRTRSANAHARSTHAQVCLSPHLSHSQSALTKENDFFCHIRGDRNVVRILNIHPVHLEQRHPHLSRSSRLRSHKHRPGSIAARKAPNQLRDLRIII